MNRNKINMIKKIFINSILLILAIVIFAVLFVPALVFGFYYVAFHKGFRGIGEYLSGIALTFAKDIDRSGNYIGGPLLNHLFIDKNNAILHYDTISLAEFPDFCAEYKADRLFGDIRETISSVLGKNEEIDNLTKVGKAMCWILNNIQKDHCRKAISWYPKKEKNHA